jgi:uncharacterized membrane protein
VVCKTDTKIISPRHNRAEAKMNQDSFLANFAANIQAKIAAIWMIGISTTMLVVWVGVRVHACS